MNIIVDKITSDTLEIIRAKAYSEETSVSNIAERSGISRAWLSKVKKTDGDFTVAVCNDLLKTCGYRLEIVRK